MNMKKNSDLTFSMLRKARLEVDEAYKEYTKKKQILDEIKNVLLDRLHAEGMRTFGDDKTTISIANRANIIIKDELALKFWLDKNIEETDLYYHQGYVFNKQAVDGIARAKLKTDGEIIPGTEVETTEYLSISNRGGKRDEAIK